MDNAGLLVVLDVDGVTRRGVTDRADPAVTRGVRALINAAAERHWPHRIAFVSGTPSAPPDHELPDWCGPNAPLTDVFGAELNDLLSDGVVEIHGQLGGDTLRFDPILDRSVGIPVMAFTKRQQLDIFAALLDHYHRDVKRLLNPATAEELADLAAECMTEARAQLQDTASENEACSSPPLVLERYVHRVRDLLDADFRLVSNGATVEYHDFATRGPWSSDIKIDVNDAFQTAGVAHRNGRAFRFVLVSRTNKGATVHRISMRFTDESSVRPLLITVGDTDVDYSMHALAQLSFHVGLRSVWESHHSDAEHVVLLEDQGVSGTAAVLGKLTDAVRDGTALSDLALSWRA